MEHVAGREVTTMERIQCGAFAGLVAQTVTYPIEVTRRRMQTIGMLSDTAVGCLGVQQQRAAQERLPSMGSTVMDLYKEQGVRGFFKGVSMNWMKGPIAFGISFTVFDTVQGMMETDAERAHKLPGRFRRE
jgi:solute carrier family 25 protein 42